MTLKLLETLLAQGRIDRREFIRTAMALGATATLPGILSRQAQADGPKRGGHFIVGIGDGATTDSFNPTTWDSGFTNTLAYSFANNLTEVNHQGKLVPELAESWEGSEGATRWVFQLRQGVTFHNGKSLTPQDVIDSYNLHRGEDSTSPVKSLMEPIQEIRAEGNALHFTLASGNADFPFVLSNYYLPILPSDGNGGVVLEGIGTGPYIAKEFQPGVRAVFERNPDYWKADRAHFDSAELLSIADITARTNALTTGEIHAMDRVDLKTVHLLQRNADIAIARATSGTHYVMPMNVNTPPFDNPDVRLALKLLINREEMVQKVLRGYGTVANDHPVSPIMPFHASLAQRQYDPEQARALLQKAGHANLSLDLSAADVAFPGAVDAAVLYKEQAAAAGVNINVVREPNDGYWSNVWRKKPWCMAYWSARPTPDIIFTTVYAAEADWNDTGWANARFNELLVAARAELDGGKRAEMYQEMQQLVRDDGGTPVIMFADIVAAHSTAVAHEGIAGDRHNDGGRILERWWFA